MDTEAIERSCKYLNQLFTHSIENMKSGFNIWRDFTYKASKLHVALKSICQAVSGFLEAFQKMADLATNAKGATKEIGVALTRLCLRHRNIEKKLDHVTHTFENSLIGPIEEKLEDWKKLVFQIEKEHARDSKKAIREYKKISLQAEKIEKKNKKDSNLHKELTNLNMEKKEKLVAMETIEKSSVRSALLEERRRHCHLVLAMKPFVDAEMALLSDLMHLEEIMSSLTRQAQEPNVLPTSSEQVILDITSQTIPEGWSCQSTRSFPTPSDSLLSLSSVYSASNRSSIVSEFDAQSAITDVNLNASLSSLPVSLLRNHRAGGSVPPPLDRGSRNGRPLFRQSLYNPSITAGSQCSSNAGITYLQQQHQSHQQRQKQMENGSRLLFPSTSAPTTPEVKIQPSSLTSYGQQKVVGKPPTFPPSYLRRKGSFGRALQQTQQHSSFSSSPTSAALPSFQSSWADSDRPRSLALGSSGQNQFAHSFSEQMVCSLAPPASQNPSLSSSSTLKDDDEEREEENQNNVCSMKDPKNDEIAQECSVTPSNQSPPKSIEQSRISATISSVPTNVSSPTRNVSCEMTQQTHQETQKGITSAESRSRGRSEYASPHVLIPRRSLPTNQTQRPPFAVPPQQIIDGYKIHAEIANKSTPSPKSVNYVDFHSLAGSSGVFGYPGNTNGNVAKASSATNQVFINLDKTPISHSNVNTSQVQSSQQLCVSSPQAHSNIRCQSSGVKPDVHHHRLHHQQHLAQLESEPHAYGIFLGKPNHSASFDQHFQEKIITFNPQQQQTQGSFVNLTHKPSSPQVKCTSVSQHHYPQVQSHRGYPSPSTKRQLPPPPPSQANIVNSLDGRSDIQFCPWTLRAGSPDRSGSTTPTNEGSSTPLPPPPPPSEQIVNVRSSHDCPTHCLPQCSGLGKPSEQQLPKGFVKHWENSV